MLRLFALASALLVRSESLRARLVAHGAPAEKIHLHRTGVPLEQITFRPRTAPDEGAWHCLQACRLIAKKGLPTTFRAFAAFAKEWPNARLTIAGEGPQRPALEQLATELGIADRVRFSGFVSQDELRELEASAHLFLHPSEVGPDGDQEGVPNAMLEAMASGLPVCATIHGGIPEAVESGVTGLLVPERDAGRLADAMLSLSRDPQRYSAMGAAASRRVTQEFALANQVRRLEAIYSEVVTAAAPSVR
jgi:glycosyltransferase involved in cell wall biosynthesis